MKRTFTLVLFITFLSGCADDTPLLPINPALVNLQINLTNIQYQNLRQIGGFVYLEGGHRGLIVFRQTQTTYLVWDRLCPNEPKDECGVVEMDASGFFMIDPCCDSTYDLDGNPTACPSRYPLIQYNANSDGTFLYISN